MIRYDLDKRIDVRRCLLHDTDKRIDRGSKGDDLFSMLGDLLAMLDHVEMVQFEGLGESFVPFGQPVKPFVESSPPSQSVRYTRIY